MCKRHLRGIVLIVCSIGVSSLSASSQELAYTAAGYEFNDSHFHLTNYIQESTPIREFLKIMGTTTGRSTLFGIPVQQLWSYRTSGDTAPTYDLHSDAPLYYYSFTDAYIASTYLSLSPKERERFDPMITGFNPEDMYASDHIRRVLQTFPGVFCGIGEFTIHREFVSSKVASDVPSLSDPPVDRILDLAEESGLVVLIHNDIDIPFADQSKPPTYLDPMTALLRRHPGTTIIWAHMGVGPVVRPVGNYAQILEDILNDPGMSHVMFDISSDEVAGYLVASADSLKIAADLINRYPDRFLFGTDTVAPKDQAAYFETYHLYDPLWPLLTTEASLKVRKANYERIFDEAKSKVRTWEASNGLTSTTVSTTSQ